VTGLTKVCVAPTEPLRDGATELALEFNKVRAMLGAILDAGTDTHSGALTAY